jgi:hypothetical protein
MMTRPGLKTGRFLVAALRQNERDYRTISRNCNWIYPIRGVTLDALPAGEFMRAHLKTVLAALALLSLTASGASAVEMMVTITGTTTDNYFGATASDPTDEFGLTDLGGQNFTAVITYNTNVGVRTTSPGEDSLVNSAAIPDTASATITINGHTLTIAGNNTDYEGDQAIVYGPARLFHYDITDDYRPADGSYIDNNLFLGARVTGLPATLTGTLAKRATTDTGGSILTIHEDNSADQLTHYAQIFLVTDTITISAVPEPATWAMLLTGFGGIGLMMRRARRKPARVTT